MIDVVQMFKELKEDVEKQKFMEAQHRAMLELRKQNAKLKEEVEHLQQLLTSTTQLIESEQKTHRVIITPEEALIERQIEMIQVRGLAQELTLEDTKKLDLLLKNKKLTKEQQPVVQVESNKPDRKNLSSQELILIASKKKDE